MLLIIIINLKLETKFCNISSKELSVDGNICDFLENYFGVLRKYEKLYARQFDSKIGDYGDIIQKEKTDSCNNKLDNLPIHKNIKNLDLDNVMMDFDATSFYPSAI